MKIKMTLTENGMRTAVRNLTQKTMTEMQERGDYRYRLSKHLYELSKLMKIQGYSDNDTRFWYTAVNGIKNYRKYENAYNCMCEMNSKFWEVV